MESKHINWTMIQQVHEYKIFKLTFTFIVTNRRNRRGRKKIKEHIKISDNNMQQDRIHMHGQRHYLWVLHH